ncbi:nucleotidyl transferase AbiEii/AbiGii toxin family protein [Planomonospora sp. ID82291]|uniref:nucleotidyl transferase AbiEii/AbiGii toxin family protein n=1 Tax=Planomonospora sp. ID82291 TaxID=2738136 RepID=UPI0018C42DC3|nr:nucleotidyl transferase AbiEii/AbiGii toxin family protein [Planomonospora sp. ID82291]MBG0815717.1 nucleotidyl transferase AbiEii/AbiGii toxin family protein [Planomonospora sp. ID82291]
MDPRHRRLARVGLAVIARYGFALAGGYAVQAHGFLTRLSDDVDLFTASPDESGFAEAVEAVVAAYLADGLTVTVDRRSATFARLLVADGQGPDGKVELGLDRRAHPPTFFEIGPVLHSDDAVANKVCALFGRGEVRDYIDVHAILASGRYTGEQLLTLAAGHDPGFDRDWFSQALRAVERLPRSSFEPYGMPPGEAAELVRRLTRWADDLIGHG